MRAFRSRTNTRLVRVPDLVGLPSVEAQAIAEGLGFHVTGPDGALLASAGVVVSQRPGAGGETRAGAIVQLWVQRGRGNARDRGPRTPPPEWDFGDPDEPIRVRELVGVR